MPDRATTSRGYRVGSVPSLDEIPANRWNALPGAASFYLSHEWLSFVECDRSADPDYLLVSSGEHLVGALPTYAVAVEHNADYQIDRVIGRPVDGSFLLAGTRRGYVNRLMVDAATPQQGDDVVALLLDGAARRAGALGLDGTAFLYLDTTAADALRRVDPHLEPLLVDSDTVLDVPGATFDDYVDELGSRRAWSVRREMRDFAAAGYDMSVARLSECWYDAGPLVSQVQFKYGHDDSPDDCRSGLEAQADAMDEYTVVFCARRGTRLVAVSLFYAWRGALYGRVVGFDYGALVSAHEYFTIYFYEPLRYAYRHGYRRLHLGRGSYAAKVRRGARPVPSWALLPSGHGPGVDWRAWNRDAVGRWASECQVPTIDIPADWTAV